jgi:hypothetical protein
MYQQATLSLQQASPDTGHHHWPLQAFLEFATGGPIELVRIHSIIETDGLQPGDLLGIAKANDTAPGSLWLIRHGQDYLLKRRYEIEPLLRRASLRMVGSDSGRNDVEVAGLVVFWLKASENFH